MFDLMHFTKTEQEKILKSIQILVDTREQVNDHILSFFNSKKIPWKEYKLDYADYSFYIPKNEEMNIPRDLYFDKHIVIERKANLEELSKNFTSNSERNRLKTEFKAAPKSKLVIIENASYEKLVNGSYETSYNPKSYWASIFSMWHKYNIPFIFINDKRYTGSFIYGYLYYYLYAYLNGGLK